MSDENRLFKWVLKNGEYCISDPIDSFSTTLKIVTDTLKVTEKNICRCRPDNVTTAWEIERDYGINKQKTSRVAREGTLNAFMLGMKNFYILKWFIERDELLENYIATNKKTP